MARKFKGQNKRRTVSKTTLLVVGEGPDDQAFIKHMNQQFRNENTQRSATIKKESGGSPGNIITNTTRKYQNSDYDQRIIVLDSDIPVGAASRALASKHGFAIVLWSPTCLEGALLDVLGEPVHAHESNQALKGRLHPRLAAHHTEPEAYAGLFPKPILKEAVNASVVQVRSALTGKTGQ
ncbi:hypothetical protein NFC81_02225 [Salinispirillum sp. LH 10-3-1]|uniref:RloB domain-containing protein n=1 Tax=Salinispirillum sp. LH 10-3-1 TaxID=2952525 RepID=A0AB38YGW9_9GAMM